MIEWYKKTCPAFKKSRWKRFKTNYYKIYTACYSDNMQYFQRLSFKRGYWRNRFRYICSSMEKCRQFRAWKTFGLSLHYCQIKSLWPTFKKTYRFWWHWWSRYSGRFFTFLNRRNKGNCTRIKKSHFNCQWAWPWNTYPLLFLLPKNWGYFKIHEYPTGYR